MKLNYIGLIYWAFGDGSNMANESWLEAAIFIALMHHY